MYVQIFYNASYHHHHSGREIAGQWAISEAHQASFSYSIRSLTLTLIFINTFFIRLSISFYKEFLSLCVSGLMVILFYDTHY